MKMIVAAMIGCAATSGVCSGQVVDDARQWTAQMPGNAADDATVFFDSGNDQFSLPGNNIASYSLPLGRRSAVFGYVGMPGEALPGVSSAYLLPPLSLHGSESGSLSHWLDSRGYASKSFTVGYAWRTLKLEGAAFSGPAQDDRNRLAADMFKLDSTSTRLSYSPSPNWSFQISRGTLSGLDQLAPEEEVRRVAVAATYKHMLSNGNWQSTLAWGRNTRKSREPTMGYLLESTLRFNGVHTVFGRVEQVGSSELALEGGGAQNRAFKLNRITVGYFREVGAHGPVKLDAGAFVSRYAVPSSASTVYGGEPNSFVLFVRLNLR